MAKPRVFVSSTYYDLRHIRNSLETFIESFGYEAVLFESGDIAFHHDTPIDESCYNEIQNCHMLVLIVGGRYGSATSDPTPLGEDEINTALQQFNSITKKEYETARERDIPIFIFVEKSVFSEYQTFKENRDNSSINYAQVDSNNIFRLLDDIIAQRRNNFVRPFDSIDDITKWLRDQWAGLFADVLSQKKSETSLKDLASQLSGLRQVVSVLKEYSESIMRKVQPEDFLGVIQAQEKKLRDNKIQTFVTEPLIATLIGCTIDEPTTKEALYESFEKSANFDDFINKSGFVGDKVNDLIGHWRDPAEAEFTHLKRKYLDDVEIIREVPMKKSAQRGKAIGASPQG